MRGLHLFAGGPRLGPDLLEFLLQFREPRATDMRLGRPRRRRVGHGFGHVGKHDQHRPLQRPRLVEPLDGDLDALRGAVVVSGLKAVERHALFMPERFLKGFGQFIAHPFPRHGKDIPVGFAGGRLQVFAGPSADIEDVALVIGEYGRRRVVLQDQLVGQRLEAARRFRCRAHLGAQVGGDSAERRGEFHRVCSHGGLRTAKEP